MSESFDIDVTVIGAGPAALAAALGFAQAKIPVIVCETSPGASAAASSGRSAALLMRTVAFLDGLGVWPACANAAAPLETLQFIDDTGRTLRAPDCAFRASEIGEAAFGYNIANAELVSVLARAVNERGIRMLNTGGLKSLDRAGDHAQVMFEDGTAITSRLIVAADGRNSAAREAAGMRKLSWDYNQIAIATAFAHERQHHGVCIELHRAGGPFTLVPLPGGRSSLVWVERKAEAERLASLSDDAFAREAEKVSRFALGRIHEVAPRARFPLSSLVARDYGKDRVALAGEAAHVNPPIGAQGLNLGFRDVATLLSLVREEKARDGDIGGDALLKAYSAARRGDVLSRTFGVDMLNRSLLSAFLPLQFARGAGLYALGSIGPLRRAFMRRGIAPANLG